MALLARPTVPLLLLLWSGSARAADFRHALVIIADDFGTDKMGAYAVDVDNPTESRPSTPAMDVLAGAGVRFTDAWATPICSPTRALLYTGEYAHRNGIGQVIGDTEDSHARMALDPPSIQQLASDAGMSTALFGKAHFGERDETPDSATSVQDFADFPILSGFDWFSGNTDGTLTSYTSWLYMRSVPSSVASSGYYTSAQVNRTVSPTNQTTNDALVWMDEHAALGERMLAVVSYHLPHSTGSGSSANWASAVSSCGGTSSGNKTEDYRFTVECLDTELAEFLADVPELDDTLVVFLGDNGTPSNVAEGNFADSRGKATLFESGARVPFVIADGAALKDAIDNGGVLPDGGSYRIDAGTTASDPASVVDLYATLADYLDLSTEACTPGSTCGRDSLTLRSVLSGGPAERTYVYTELFTQETNGVYTGGAAIRMGDYKLIGRVMNADAPCRSYLMYDLATDRWEQTNLFEDEAYADIRDTLLAQFELLADEVEVSDYPWAAHADCDACATEETWYDGFDSTCDAGSDFDQDADGVDWPTDCDDVRPTVFPGAEDIWYDGIDADCAGDSDFDMDLDGADIPADCDDADPLRFPGAEETWYDGVDSNCDGANDFDRDGDGSSLGYDCDDGDGDAYPGAEETWYDGVDQGCDGGSDFDQDADGVDWPTDCDDTRPLVRPGAADTWYDGVDSDCDGADDYDQDGDGERALVGGGLDCEDTDPAVGPLAPDAWYDGVDSNCDGADDFDQDGDTIQLGPDCDDTDGGVYPGAPDAWYDGLDANCDGADDFDQDGDTFQLVDDCDDTDPGTWPGAAELPYDGVDSDCGGDSDYDADGDGFDALAWGGTDCDDADAGIWPGAPEIAGDGVDSDCDGAAEALDRDRDGSATGLDCDDDDPAAYPGAPEVWYDGVDQDCLGGDDFDQDADGQTPTAFGGTDCDDTLASVRSGATEVWYDGVDQDCDGADDFDQDADGYPSSAYGGTDCNDTSVRIRPGTREVWYDGVDQNCDGANDYDRDGDGFTSSGYGGTDCDDTRVAVRPGATEIWYDGVDQNCDGRDDYDKDGDGWPRDTDCNDSAPRVYPGAPGWNLDCTRAR